MVYRHPFRTLAAAALLLGGCLVLLAAAWLTARDPLLSVTSQGAGGIDSMPFEQALCGLFAAALLGCAVWLLVTATLATASYVARELCPDNAAAAALSEAIDHRCPRTVRRLVTAVLGVAVTAGVAGPAAADASHDPQLTGLSLPDRPTGSTVATVAPRTLAPRTVARPARTVVVEPGDSLWSISADLLPASATDIAITHGWHRLHRANLRRVGRDPDLILPGTRLVVPELAAPDRKDPL